MEDKEIFDKVLAIVKPFVRNEAAFAKADNGTRILQDLGVNSARLVDIVLAFEDEFGVEIDDDTADGVRTVGDAVAAIKARQ
jgi:acyl carrier protein